MDMISWTFQLADYSTKNTQLAIAHSTYASMPTGGLPISDKIRGKIHVSD